MNKVDRTRSRIIDCAYELFMASSYEAVRIVDIAKAANISTATFYNHFGTKENLLIALYVQKTEITEEDYQRIISQPTAWERLRCLHRIYAEKMICIGKNLCTHLMTINTELANLSKPRFPLIETLIEQAQAEGSILSHDAAATLTVCCSYMMKGLYFYWCYSGDEFHIEHEVRRSMETLYNVAPALRIQD